MLTRRQILGSLALVALGAAAAEADDTYRIGFNAPMTGFAAADGISERYRSVAISLVLAGGSTPRRLYGALAAEPYRSGVDWARVEVLWGDGDHETRRVGYMEAMRDLYEAYPRLDVDVALFWNDYDGLIDGVECPEMRRTKAEPGDDNQGPTSSNSP